MVKTLGFAAALLLIAASASPVSADLYGRGGGYGWGHGGGYREDWHGGYSYHEHHGGGWVGPGVALASASACWVGHC
jgi:Spy/CpxP family protein refolding chaperone